MNKITLRLTGLISLLTPLAAVAHPGHGPHDHDGGYTIIHYFTQPTHALSLLAISAVVVMLYRSLRRKDQKA